MQTNVHLTSNFDCSVPRVSGGVGVRARSESRKTVLTFWAIGSEVEIIGEMFDEFRRENPVIDLRVQQIPWSAAHEKLLTAFAGDATPDVCQLGNTWIPEFATLEALEPLDAYIERSQSIDQHDYFPGLWETNRMNGHVYGIPWYADTRLSVLSKGSCWRRPVGSPPRTWDEWLAAMRDVKAKVNPKRLRDPDADERVGASHDSWLADRERRCCATMADLRNFDSPEFRQALEFYASVV